VDYPMNEFASYLYFLYISLILNYLNVKVFTLVYKDTCK